jgi:hypothetical protein
MTEATGFEAKTIHESAHHRVSSATFFVASHKNTIAPHNRSGHYVRHGELST